MNDSRRVFEQKALRNVRTLFEDLERADLLSRKRQVFTVCVILLITGSFLGAVVAWTDRRPADTERQRRIPCELAAWNTRAAEFERRMRETNPDMPYRDVQKRLERERPYLMAAAKLDCNPQGDMTRDINFELQQSSLIEALRWSLVGQPFSRAAVELMCDAVALALGQRCHAGSSR